MPRRRPPDLLTRVVAAGLEVFATRGFRLALMSDVAAAAGVSQGTIYNVVESKDALLHAVFENLITGEITANDGMVQTPSTEDTARLVRKGLASRMASPRLDTALTKRRGPADVQRELSEIVIERFEVLEASHRLLSLVERCASDVGWLHHDYFGSGRRQFHDRLTELLQKRIASGALREVPDAAVTARFINESITWFAWHRHGDPTGRLIDRDAALEGCVDMVVTALTPREVDG